MLRSGIFRSFTDNVRSFSARTLPKVQDWYDTVRMRSTQVLPMLNTASKVIGGISRSAQTVDNVSPAGKKAISDFDNSVSQFAKNFTTGVNKWNLMHDIAFAPG